MKTVTYILTVASLAYSIDLNQTRMMFDFCSQFLYTNLVVKFLLVYIYFTSLSIIAMGATSSVGKSFHNRLPSDHISGFDGSVSSR